MKSFKRIFSVLLALLILISSAGITALATELDELLDTDEFSDPEGEAVITNTSSDSYPDMTAEADFSSVEKFYGVTDSAGAPTIDSMFSEEAWEEFRSGLDRILCFEPVEEQAVSNVLSKTGKFVKAGGLQNGTNGMLQAGVGLSANRTEKVTVLNSEMNNSAWIYVVDKDAMCVTVLDGNNKGIESALVTISYEDESGNRIMKSTLTTGGHVPGIAVFDNVPDGVSGILDIQAEGYHAVSILDREMRAGKQTTFSLTPAEENELYLRGVDLAGKDMLYEDTKITLMPSGTESLMLHVLVTKRGNEELPDSIELYSENRKTAVITMEKTSGYEYDGDTAVYAADKMWIDQSAGLFAEGDIISVRAGAYSKTLKHLTVENAVIEPGIEEADLPVSEEGMAANLSDVMGGSGWLNLTVNALKIPVTFGRFPDGGGIILATYDLKKLMSDETKAKMGYSSLFKESWNPKTYDSASGLFETFKKSFWENAEKIKAGKVDLDSPEKVKWVSNKSYSININFSAFLAVTYNKTDKKWDGSGGLSLTASYTGGVTEYFLIPVGAAVIPAYAGFEAGASLKGSLSVNFDVTEGEKKQENRTVIDFHYWDSNPDMTGRLDLVLTFSLFGGLGVRGALGADATGYINADFATVLSSKWDENGKPKTPHAFIDVFYGLKFNYYLLMFSGTVTIDCLQSGPKRLCGNYDGDNEQSFLLGSNEVSFTDLDLSSCASDLSPLLSGSGSGTGALAAYTLKTDGSLSASGIADTVDAGAYPDSQVQFVSTQNHTALFRIISEGERTSLIYQLQDPETGRISSVVYKVTMPENLSVTEFMAVPNRAEPMDSACEDNVFIAAIVADNTVKDLTERAKTSAVAVVTVNLKEGTALQCEIISNEEERGSFYYSAPKPAGSGSSCVAAYGRTPVASSVSGLLQNMDSATENVAATDSFTVGGKRIYRELGTGKLFTNGAIVPYQCTYWMVDGEHSSEDTLFVVGFTSKGRTFTGDSRFGFTLDISDMDYENYDSIISNWQYLDGRCYFLAGGNVYWMDKVNVSGQYYDWQVEEVINGHGLTSADGTYQMITNSDRTAVYLVGVISDYQVDLETGTAKKSGSRVSVHTLLTYKPYYSDRYYAKLHGPVMLEFADGEEISNFTAAYNPDACSSKGISVVYSSPASSVTLMSGDNAIQEKSNIREWRQNAFRGMVVTDVKIPEPLVSSDSNCIEAVVTYQNLGYMKEGPVRFAITDGNGHRLTELCAYDGFREMKEGEGHWNADLYTGDSDILHLFFKPDSSWNLNEEQEIIIEVEYPRYEGALPRKAASALLSSDNMTLSAENVLIGDRHYADVKLEKNSIIGTKEIQIRIEPDCTGEAFGTGTSESPAAFYYSFEPEETLDTEHTYCCSIDLEHFWEECYQKGIKGAFVSLVSRKGEQLSNGVVYLENPYEPEESEQPDNPDSEDEPGKSNSDDNNSDDTPDSPNSGNGGGSKKDTPDKPNNGKESGLNGNNSNNTLDRPGTGDSKSILLYAVSAGLSLLVILYLISRKRRASGE